MNVDLIVLNQMECLKIDDTVIDDVEGEIVRTRTIPLAAIASWSELLGIDDPGEALDAIVHVRDVGEPGPDPVAGESVWDEPYAAETTYEQVVRAEESVARREGTANDPRSPKLRGKLKGLEHKPRRDAARGRARKRLGLPDVAAPQAQARSARAARVAVVDPLDGVKADLRGALGPQVASHRARFRQGLAPNIQEASDGR